MPKIPGNSSGMITEELRTQLQRVGHKNSTRNAELHIHREYIKYIFLML